MVEKHKQVVEDVELQDNGDAPEMRNYLKAFVIVTEADLVTLLALSSFLFYLLCSLVPICIYNSKKPKAAS